MCIAERTESRLIFKKQNNFENKFLSKKDLFITHKLVDLKCHLRRTQQLSLRRRHGALNSRPSDRKSEVFLLNDLDGSAAWSSGS